MKRLFVLLIATACTPAPGPESVVSDTACITGVVANMGVDQQNNPVLRTEESEIIPLTGSAAVNVLKLAGAKVTVCGAREAASMVVHTYKIREADGMPAYSGILLSDGTGFALDREGQAEKVPLVDVPSSLSAELNHEVWVAGEWSGGSFVVKSFGVVSRGGS